jgi:hypothetical protein
VSSDCQPLDDYAGINALQRRKKLTTRTEGSTVNALPKVKRLNAMAKIVVKRIMISTVVEE